MLPMCILLPTDRFHGYSNQWNRSDFWSAGERYLSPKGRGRRARLRAPGEGLAKNRRLSRVERPSPRPSPLRGEGVRTRSILVTGFGPFPGMECNPTEQLVRALGRRRDRHGSRVVAHVFETSYAAVDSELPVLIRRHNPSVILMFGVAAARKRLRIETFARNALSRVHEDAAGHLPAQALIEKTGPVRLPLRTPSRRLLGAARASGFAAEISDDAGNYLCNYLCWHASRIAAASRASRLVAFVHVPQVRPLRLRSRRRNYPATLGDLIAAAEAILDAATQVR
jgi:pyroglutamyl-peptidase